MTATNSNRRPALCPNSRINPWALLLDPSRQSDLGDRENSPGYAAELVQGTGHGDRRKAYRGPGAEAVIFPSQSQATVADDQLIVARSSQSLTAVRAARRQSRTRVTAKVASRTHCRRWRTSAIWHFNPVNRHQARSATARGRAGRPYARTSRRHWNSSCRYRSK